MLLQSKCMRKKKINCFCLCHYKISLLWYHKGVKNPGVGFTLVCASLPNKAPLVHQMNRYKNGFLSLAVARLRSATLRSCMLEGGDRKCTSECMLYHWHAIWVLLYHWHGTGSRKKIWLTANSKSLSTIREDTHTALLVFHTDLNKSQSAFNLFTESGNCFVMTKFAFSAPLLSCSSCLVLSSSESNLTRKRVRPLATFSRFKTHSLFPSVNCVDFMGNPPKVVTSQWIIWPSTDFASLTL